uniref:Uncharacterized protein n=1 Tax=Sphaerodactylus townsendi TaxID=933632 RepID=A0ACB8FJS5_9SAUR
MGPLWDWELLLDSSSESKEKGEFVSKAVEVDDEMEVPEQSSHFFKDGYQYLLSRTLATLALKEAQEVEEKPQPEKKFRTSKELTETHPNIKAREVAVDQGFHPNKTGLTRVDRTARHDYLGDLLPDLLVQATDVGRSHSAKPVDVGYTPVVLCSRKDSAPQVLLPEEEKIIVEETKSNGQTVIEEKSLVDTVYALKDEVQELRQDNKKMKKSLEEEQRARKELEKLVRKVLKSMNDPSWDETNL